MSILLVHAPQQRLAAMFMRVQETYENPHFLGKLFTVGEFISHELVRTGEFNYFSFWDGFNVPASLIRHHLPKMTPVEKFEMPLWEAVNSRPHITYVIGASEGDQETIDHELQHAYFSTNLDYQEKCCDFYNAHPALAQLLPTLRDIGYGESVLIDEVLAYLVNGLDWINELSIISTEVWALRKEFRAAFFEPLTTTIRHEVIYL